MKMDRKQLAKIAEAAAVAQGARVTAIHPDGAAMVKQDPKGKRAKRVMPDHCLLEPLRGRWEVSIPDWHPATVNQLTKRDNHFKASKLKWNDALIVGRSLREAGVPAATMKRRVGLVIVLAKGQRGADGDAYWKSLLDALQRCRALTGDNRQRCETTPVEYERAETKATRILLEDVA